MSKYFETLGYILLALIVTVAVIDLVSGCRERGYQMQEQY